MSATAPSFDTVLAWHWREWGHAEADADVEEWRTRLAGRCRNDAIPFTLLAHVGADPVGCVTVCHEDRDPRFADRGPWLAGMIVVGPARNLGVGRTLLRAAEQQARYSLPSTHTDARDPMWLSGITWYVPSWQVMASSRWLKTPCGES